mmetsp:Transcript_3199/g.12871  ORF Transcript_3199/g.12871 Transcript_3199/m.12871 type:complete len:208 (+) Transcript_3199:532-1155(+)
MVREVVPGGFEVRRRFWRRFFFRRRWFRRTRLRRRRRRRRRLSYGGRGRPSDAHRLGPAKTREGRVRGVRDVRGGELGGLLRRVPVPVARDAVRVLGVRKRAAFAAHARRARRERARGRGFGFAVLGGRGGRKRVGRKGEDSFRRASGGDSRVAPRRAGDGDAARLARAHDGAGQALSRRLFSGEPRVRHRREGLIVRTRGGRGVWR